MPSSFNHSWSVIWIGSALAEFKVRVCNGGVRRDGFEVFGPCRFTLRVDGPEMITDEQWRLLMSELNLGRPLRTASAKSGMSVPMARRHRDAGLRPSESRRPRKHRTRPDPFSEVWTEVEELLEVDSGLEAKTLFEELQLRYPGQFGEGQLRTLQRRVREWRSCCGPSQEVYFSQVRSAGEQCQSDFTDMRRVGGCIDAEPYAHLCYHFVLPCSKHQRSVLYSRHSPTENPACAGMQDH